MAAISSDSIEQSALALPVTGRASLVEKLLASLEGQINPQVEASNLEIVRTRQKAARPGQSKFVDGDDAFRQARAALRK